MARRGRPTVFPNKTRFLRVKVSDEASQLFESARLKLHERIASLRQPSDSDTFEFIIRGERARRAYLPK